jgi:hypothetical protein
MISPVLHLSPPFRAEHIGSLKRPNELLQKRALLDQGKITREELGQVEDKYVDQIVKLQRDIGIKAVTDGEFRRWVQHATLKMFPMNLYPDRQSLSTKGICFMMDFSTTWTA